MAENSIAIHVRKKMEPDDFYRFIKAFDDLESNKAFIIRFRNQSTTVFIDFYNLPEGYYSGAELENNRGLYAVQQLRNGKWKLEVLVHSFSKETNPRGKTGTYDQVVNHLKKSILNIHEKNDYHFTHSKPLEFMNS